MKKYIAIFMVCFLCGCLGKSQEKSIEETQESEVLQYSEVGIDKEFVITTEPIYRRSIVYLGSWPCSNDDTCSVLNVTNFTGLTEDAIRANSRVVLYSNGNRLGYYSIGDISQLPYKLSDEGELFFPVGQDCADSNKVDLSGQIPKKIFLSCRNGSGDLIELKDEW